MAATSNFHCSPHFQVMYSQVISVVLSLALCFTSVQATFSECTPPVVGCLCDVQVMQCAGAQCKGFPDDAPEHISEYIFNGCTFPQPITNVPYTEAQVLSIVNSQGKLEIKDDAFQELTKLELLELRGNNLQEIRRDMFTGLGELKTLSLAMNRISVLNDTVFALLVSLEKLLLTGNPGVTITRDAFSGVETLKELKLDSCALSEIPSEALRDNRGLRALNLFQNPLKSVPKEAFARFESLQELRMNECQLEELDEDSFDGLEKLLLLDLSHNSLSELDDDLLDSSEDSIRKLYLNNNQFKTIPVSVSPSQMQ